ncbi:MAG: biotin/lipoyl-containing protein, partial [Gaiellaceae bacterium]
MSTGTQIEVVMPQMGVSVSEGTVTKWLKQPGEAIGRDESLLEISTDKVDTEIPSPGDGVLVEILVPEGETVEVGTVLARIGPAGSEVATGEPEAPAPAVQPEEPAPVEQPVAAATAPVQPAPAQAPESAPVAQAGGNGRTFLSPVVARIAAQHGVDASAVPGTGTGGRVTKKDILAFIESGAVMTPPSPEPPPALDPQPPAPEPLQVPPQPTPEP